MQWVGLGGGMQLAVESAKGRNRKEKKKKKLWLQ